MCTNLLEIERNRNIVLPSAYKNWFKNEVDRNKSFIGSDIDFPNLSELNDWARELLEESSSEFVLEDQHFVFLMHQGYSFFFFRCDGAPDPEVWYFLEGNDKPIVRWGSFSELISAEL